MGLFDRFFARTPAPRVATLAPPPPTPSVPDVDNDDSGLPHDVRAHLEALTRAAELDVDDLTPEEFDAALTSRIVGAERLEASGLDFRYAAAFAPNLREVLTLDLPSAVITLPDERVAARGVRMARLLDLGRQNLRSLVHTSHPELLTVGEGGRTVRVLMGDSPYTASFARFLSEVVETHDPEADMHGGVVFALPHRHAVVYQTCATPQQTRDALDLVPAHAEAMRADGLSPVSPHVYHWLAREVTCLTEVGRDGGLVLRTTPELETLMGAGRHRAAG
ncbi:hypothetical protein KC207_16585 [Phycicoccus sp. BSK3Z-2]|uniref:Uncharacterized protein n=1 Tax=Phycicoccus avicenniae TaxID=2828860 RepID=A0A941DAA8_9MICO|nr:hypothetical protein [Phycicoccus avicenniae]MBR7744913.1 hypothetical protein [Phycicoccus avicenniae]